MDAATRILIVEDLPADAGLAEREIRKTLGSCVFTRVETREDFLAALDTFAPDVIVSDYRMPRFDGMAALRLAAERAPGVPVVILTSAINEDTAVECMKAGASDYVIKEHIKRLGQAVSRALDERRLQEANAAVERELHVKSCAVESSMSAISLADLSGRIIYANQSFLRLWKYASADDVIGRQIGEFATAPKVVDEAIEELRQNRGYLGEDVARCADGSTVEVQVSASTVTDASGEPLCLMASFLDLSERRRAEATMRLLAHAMESISEIATITDLDDRLTYVNEAFVQTYGYSREEVIGRHIGLVWSPTNPIELQREILAKSRIGSFKGEVLNLRKDGREFPISLRTSQVRDHEGVVIGLLGISEDITERRQLEAQLLQAQKMDAIGRLAGGIAHDFNNMMGVVLGYAELVQDVLSPADPLSAHVQAIIGAAQKSSNLTRQLLAFARRQVVAPEVINVNDALTGLRGMLARLVGEDIQVSFHPAEGLWNVRIDPTQIDQILANLATNARDAIENVGSILIGTSNVEIDAAYAADHLDVAPGEYVELSFSDTGKGMNRATQARIFEPFFTTKAPGAGTGLGLATVFGIVKQNGGVISVYSEPGHGTTFRILLPRFHGKATPAARRVADEPSRGTETILVVEDEEQLLELARLALEGHGYNVLAARSCGDAIVACERHLEPIHLVLTDVVMPDMNGRELVERLCASRPGMKTLFMSGYTADVVTSRGIVEQGVHFIQKPFTPTQLASKVRKVLDSR